MTQPITLEYEPRIHFVPFHQRAQRWGCLVVHRRGGKTVACVNDVVARGLYTQKKDARFAYIAPFYRQAKDIAWQYLKNYAAGAITKVRESELRVELLNGAWITLYGADNPDALRGIYLDGVILDEYGDCRPALWGEVILPTLADRRGWAVFIGTPKGKNHFYQVFRRSQSDESWYNLFLPVTETDVFPTEELAEIKAQMSDEEYEQEFLCSFEAAVKGTYYADTLNQMPEERFSDTIKFDRERPVNVAADLGFSDSTAFWYWQDWEDGPHLIDYDEYQGKKLDFYFDLLDSKDYRYGEIWLPHDAKADTLQTKRSTIEQFIEKYRDDPVEIQLVPKLKKQHGIDAARFMLPKCWFRLPQTFGGVEALRAYKRKYNEITKAYSDEPEHTWASDGADAFRYFALVARERYVAPIEEKKMSLEEQIMANRPTLDDLWEEHDRIINLARRRI